MAGSPQNGNGKGGKNGGNGVVQELHRQSGPRRDDLHAWDDDAINEILAKISDGQTLRAACREVCTIKASTFCGWVIDNINGIAERYARARELQLEAWSDDMDQIASDGTNDWMEVQRKSGRTDVVFNREAVERSRLRIDTRKWIMSKVRPGKYGEHMTVESRHTEEIVFTVCAETPDDQNGNTPGGGRIPAAAGAN